MTEINKFNGQVFNPVTPYPHYETIQMGFPDLENQQHYETYNIIHKREGPQTYQKL